MGADICNCIYCEHGEELAEVEDDETFGKLVEEIRAKREAAGLNPDTGLTHQPASQQL